MSLDSQNGKEVWRQTVEHAEPEVTHSTNPWTPATPATDGTAIYAGGLIYVTDQAAVTHLIEPSPDGLKKVGENPVGPSEFTNATPALARGSIYLRTNTALYRIGK